MAKAITDFLTILNGSFKLQNRLKKSPNLAKDCSEVAEYLDAFGQEMRLHLLHKY